MQNNDHGRQIITASNGERIVVNVVLPGQQTQQLQQQQVHRVHQQSPHQHLQRTPRSIQVQIPQLQQLRPRITQVQIQQQHRHRVQVGTIQILRQHGVRLKHYYSLDFPLRFHRKKFSAFCHFPEMISNDLALFSTKSFNLAGGQTHASILPKFSLSSNQIE